MKKYIILPFLIIIISCSKNPSKSDLTIILKDELNKKAYAKSEAFKKFPISFNDSIFTNPKNKQLFEAFLRMGILEKNDTIYYLTQGGKRIYDEKKSAMLFISNYEISEIKEIKKKDNGWGIVVSISPKELQTWIKDSAVIQILKSVDVSQYIKSQDQKIEIIKTKNLKDINDKRYYKLNIESHLNQSFSF